MSNSPTVIYNITINQYASYRLYYTWKTGGEVQTPINNTGYKVLMQVRPNVDSPAIFEATTTKGKFVLGGLSGTVTLTMSDEDTGKLKPVNGIYDILMISPTNFVSRIMEGSFTVRPGVSRRTGSGLL